MYANRRNLRVLKEIGVEEHDGDVRFQTGSGNTAISHMRNETRNITLIYGRIAEILAS